MLIIVVKKGAVVGGYGLLDALKVGWVGAGTVGDLLHDGVGDSC